MRSFLACVQVLVPSTCQGTSSHGGPSASDGDDDDDDMPLLATGSEEAFSDDSDSWFAWCHAGAVADEPSTPEVR